MNRTALIWSLVLAFIIGVTLFVVLRQNAQVGTAVPVEPGIAGDRDGDGIPDEFDYQPLDPTQ